MKRIGGKMWQRYLLVLSLAAVVCLGGLGLSAAFGAGSSTLNVTTTADTSASGGACGSSSIKSTPSPLSLREATCLANNLGGEVKINVPAGTYALANGELKFAEVSGETVNIVGAGAASTIIDGQNLGRVLNIDYATVGGVKSTISGVTITRGVAPVQGGGCILAGSGDSAVSDYLTLENVVVSKCESDSSVKTKPEQYGGGLEMAGGVVVVNNSTFRENRSNSSPGSAIGFEGRSTAGGVQAFTLSKSTIVGNRTENTNPELLVGGGAVWISSTKGEQEITETTFRENESTATTEKGGAVGAAINDQTGSVKVVRSTFVGNSVSIKGGPGAIVAGAAFWLGNSGASATLQYNRFVGNSPTKSAVSGRGSINATENWWGCNAGPGNSGCDGTEVRVEEGEVPHTITSSPWLQFHATASPSTVVGPNGTSTLNANFFTDSAGTTISAANLAAFNGSSVTWSDPKPSPATINGSTGTSTTEFSGGAATATYNSSTASGSGHAVAAFDNASQVIPLTVNQKPVVTGNPSNQSVSPGATATFTASATGTPTPSVQWERSTGGAFSPIPGATSTTYSFTATTGENGNQFRATFKNTIEGSEYTATTTAATLTVAKATPTLATNASGAVIGSPIHDTATLSGGSSPGGTITFKAYAPGDTTCSAPSPAFTSSAIAVTKNGSYESGNFTPATAGEYRWTAVYSGDANNEEAVGACNAVNEKSAVTQATPTISTQASEATIGGTIHDSAVVTNGVTPGGTLTFGVYGAGNTTCSGEPLESTVVNVTGNGSYESKPFTPSVAGSYRWIATYSGDAKNKGVTGACNAANETSPVNKVIPTLSTVASQSNADGAAIFDTATFAGAYNPGGTIVFRLFGLGDTNCSKTAIFTSTSTVTQNGEYSSGAYGPPFKAGDYRWTAVYSGDANNVEVVEACNAPTETSTVGKATTAISTNAAGATLGEGIHDTATISGGVNPTGTVTFGVFGPGNTSCSGKPLETSVVNVTKNGSYESKSFSPSEAGEYRWTAVYSGDANNKGATSACNAPNEVSAVGLASPSLSTNAANGTVGGRVHDTATIAGGDNPGGTITFEAFGPDNATCEGTAAFAKPVAVSGNGEYASPDFEPKAAGSYRWTASYSGDSNNNPASSGCNAEHETSTVAQAEPTISTEATDTTIGGKVHDTATIAGGYKPGGTVVFKAFAPGDTSCSATTPAFTSAPIAVAENGSFESGEFTPGTAGDYRWTAKYSGDGNNKAATSGCNAVNETSTVAQAKPTISTEATDATLGNKVHDTATIAGGHGATGTVTFEAFGPTDTTCSLTAVETKTVPVSGDGSYASPDFKPATIGVYRWVASYSGDTNNEAVVSPCNAEHETSTITKAVTGLSSAASDAAIGSAIEDIATLSGGQGAGGTITFTAYGPNDTNCGTVAFTKTVPVSGNGSYSSTGFTPAQSGAYRWIAEYSGDAENEAASGMCGESGETSSVANAMPTISTEATDTTIGGEIEDTATLSGGQNPGGTITFEAFGPGDELCEETAAFTETVPVSGNAEYESTGFTPEPAGDYRWIARYSGDRNNTPVAGHCGDAHETSTVAQAEPTLSSAATDATLGAAIHDTAILAGGHDAGGTVTFSAYGPDDATCAKGAAFTKSVPVSGDGSYASGDFVPAAAGTYRWVVAYSGDADNRTAAAACGEAGETSTVAAPPATNPGGGSTGGNSGGDKPAVPPINPCMPAPATTAGGYVPKTKVPTGLVPGVRARIHVAVPSNLEIAATLKYRSGGTTHSVDLGSSLLENPGTRNLRLALPSALRGVLPLGSKVRLSLSLSTVPAGGSCSEPKQSHLGFGTRIVKVLLPG